MKPIVQNIFVCIASSLIALSLFVGVIWGFDEIEKWRETRNPLNEKVLAYLAENNIPYEEKDSTKYVFTYDKIQYIFLFDSEDPAYFHVVSVWSMEMTNHNTLLEIANDLTQKMKFVKVTVSDENDVVFSIEQIVDKDADIDESFSRWLNVLESTITDFYKKTKEDVRSY